MIERRDRNTLKEEILTYLKKHGSLIVFDIAGGLREEYHNVSNALLRLRRSQLVSRERTRGGPKNRAHWEYTINPKGLERLKFYRKERKDNR
jgi:DNA-binding MarR family transcriptional regulator